MDQIPEGLVQDLELRAEAAEARAEKVEARLAHVRTLLGYTNDGCTVCIMADEDCYNCPVSGRLEDE
jgi:hypothetical protein